MGKKAATRRSSTRSGGGRRAAQRVPFSQRLALQSWLLAQFDAPRLETLAEQLRDPALETIGEDGVSLFHKQLAVRLYKSERLNRDVLLGYDENIVRHWRRITDKRNRSGHTLQLKYFQYLALLFTEIYLDRYFRDPAGLLTELNEFLAEFNAELPARDQVPPFQAEQLNKLAFWNATGSGKTLLMHVNLLQYQHYLALLGNERDLNRIILLTPNEGLSRQHLGEFTLSDLDAELFQKEGRSLFAGKSIEIIDVHKLQDEMGVKTVAVDAFEGKNLVLVDEGHRGAGGLEWMDKRNRLCEQGFSFEYSATFGQALKAANKAALTQQYARTIAFDYSYRYFYADGYGKDYEILNLEDDRQEEVRRLYLTACLLVFYQQLRLFEEHERQLRPFLIERPLWVFVGGSVNAVRSQNRQQVSDVLDILLVLADFVGEPDATRERIGRLLRGQSGLHDAGGHELFAGAFAPLVEAGLSADEVFVDVLQRVFNAPAPARLHVELLKGADGEIALRLGDNEPFGVINVGDAPKLRKLCDEHKNDLVVTDRDFSGSLFGAINDKDTTVNVLIGSKKFTEGWNSWRVSTMGLMNIGRSEGSEIIQLFGRGVRLKGFDFSLKRSSKVREEREITMPRHLRTLETLHVFGIRADYMRQFKEYLAEDGLPANEDRIEFVLPVVNNLGSARLKTIRVKEGIDFKKDRKATLDAPPERLTRNRVTLDWYPKIQAEQSRGRRREQDVAEKHEATLTAQHLAFLDMNAVYAELQQLKAERSWHNLSLPRGQAEALLRDPAWYRLLIPAEELTFDGFRRVRQWQEIAVALLKKYCDRYYKHRKEEYELPHLEYRTLDPDDPNFFAEYTLMVERSREDIVAKLEEIKAMVDSGTLADVRFENLHSIAFARHLYEPLLFIQGDLVEVRPVALNPGERDFVLDLRKYHEEHADFFAGRELYLLRNRSRGKGIGFFDAGNFYPDFILWLVEPDKQYVSFVDPKGLRNLQGPDDPKIDFYQTIKQLESDLGDPAVALSSFILSVTPHREVRWWDGGMSEAEFNQRNVYFRNAESNRHIEAILRSAIE